MDLDKHSITVVIACLNEEQNLKPTYHGVIRAIEVTGFSDYEIIIVNDGSSDRTGEIAESLAEMDHHLQVIHNQHKEGFGYSFSVGMKYAKMVYLTVVPGDDEIMPESLQAILLGIGQADLIVAYPSEKKARSWIRRFFSRGFVLLMNVLFGCGLRYYNGPNVYKVRDIKRIDVNVNSFAFNAIAVVRLIRSGNSVLEVGMKTRPQASWQTNAVKFDNILSVMRDIYKLFWDIHHSSI